MITTILGIFTWVISHAWALALIAVPAVLGFLQPILSGIVDGLKAYMSTFWAGLKSMNFQEWLVVVTMSTVVGALMYHVGWQACLDWVHAHYRLITKVHPTAWWKFW